MDLLEPHKEQKSVAKYSDNCLTDHSTAHTLRWKHYSKKVTDCPVLNVHLKSLYSVMSTSCCTEKGSLTTNRFPKTDCISEHRYSQMYPYSL